MSGTHAAYAVFHLNEPQLYTGNMSGIHLPGTHAAHAVFHLNKPQLNTSNMSGIHLKDVSGDFDAGCVITLEGNLHEDRISKKLVVV